MKLLLLWGTMWAFSALIGWRKGKLNQLLKGWTCQHFFLILQARNAEKPLAALHLFSHHNKGFINLQLLQKLDWYNPSSRARLIQ